MLAILSPTYSPDVCAQVLSKIWVIMACFCVLLMANPNFDKSFFFVLRLIWGNYQATGLEDNTAQQVVEHLTQSDFNSFFTQYLYGVYDLPLKQAFEYIGINCEFNHKKNDLSKFGFASTNANNAPLV
jgi:predicted metalloprotease with PDZ domain